eukprot:TRINITY_DN7016_c2_g1_i1.p1 TRINITY_DN7016_c2_g1~~TRINITY_DN7016_c2_g1_i1.p1  ORF type:complete len:1269 (+),score=130.93 TRINITY_DN7016_c2_g1_i1:38-3844(+)
MPILLTVLVLVFVASGVLGEQGDDDDLLGGEPLGDDHPPWHQAGPHSNKPSDFWGDSKKPFRTNEWWENLVLDAGDMPVDMLPYIVRAQESGLQLCLPGEEVVDFDSVTSYFKATVAARSGEPIGPHRVIAQSDLSVTLRWRAMGDATKYITAPLVRGAPYVSFFYQQLTPVFDFLSSPILRVNRQRAVGLELTDSRFALDLGSGQTWLMYTESKVKVKFQSNAIQFTSPYEGWLRLAAGSAQSIEIFDAYASRIPTGGIVHASVQAEQARVVFEWQTTGSGPLLMMALPHHLRLLDGVKESRHMQKIYLGMMQGMEGDTWTLVYDLPPLGWNSFNPIAPDSKDAIREALRADAQKGVVAPDPYGAGKELGALARLVLIADELGEESIAADIRHRLSGYLEAWLQGSNGNPLMYEPTYGGVCSSRGLSDHSADFGSGMYNDHYFHYGYFIYAAAALAKGNPGWLNQWGSSVMHLIRDIANPSRKDQLYPPTRHKDWFRGHSWASGLFSFRDGRNQESTSEAANAWYAIQLFGTTYNNPRLRDLGRVLLATEVVSTWHYWQIGSKFSTYRHPFSEHKIAGIVWSTKVFYGTWFGSRPEYIMGIQVMPVTPATEYLLHPEWLKEAESTFSSLLGVDASWRAFMIAPLAILQPGTARQNVEALGGIYDAGNSKTNMLHWVGTRGPLPKPPPDRPTPPPAPTPPFTPTPTPTPGGPTPPPPTPTPAPPDLPSSWCPGIGSRCYGVWTKAWAKDIGAIPPQLEAELQQENGPLLERIRNKQCPYGFALLGVTWPTIPEHLERTVAGWGWSKAWAVAYSYVPWFIVARVLCFAIWIYIVEASCYSYTHERNFFEVARERARTGAFPPPPDSQDRRTQAAATSDNTTAAQLGQPLTTLESRSCFGSSQRREGNVDTIADDEAQIFHTQHHLVLFWLIATVFVIKVVQWVFDRGPRPGNLLQVRNLEGKYVGSCADDCGFPSFSAGVAIGWFSLICADMAFRVESRKKGRWDSWSFICGLLCTIIKNSCRQPCTYFLRPWDVKKLRNPTHADYTLYMLFWAAVTLPVPIMRVTLYDHSFPQVNIGSLIGVGVSVCCVRISTRCSQWSSGKRSTWRAAMESRRKSTLDEQGAKIRMLFTGVAEVLQADFTNHLVCAGVEKEAADQLFQDLVKDGSRGTFAGQRQELKSKEFDFIVCKHALEMIQETYERLDAELDPPRHVQRFEFIHYFLESGLSNKQARKLWKLIAARDVAQISFQYYRERVPQINADEALESMAA